jgi:hypothetical protein
MRCEQTTTYCCPRRSEDERLLKLRARSSRQTHLNVGNDFAGLESERQDALIIRPSFMKQGKGQLAVWPHRGLNSEVRDRAH